jgi:hypothetical protein
MELYLQSFIWAPDVQLYPLAEIPQLPPPPSPAFGLIYEGAIDQPRSTTSHFNPLILERGGRVVLLSVGKPNLQPPSRSGFKSWRLVSESASLTSISNRERGGTSQYR